MKYKKLLYSIIKIIAINIFAVNLYLLTGKSALYLSSIDGYSTPIWPAAGFALGLAIIFGKRIWPGLFIGALLTNTKNILDIENYLTYYNENFHNVWIAFGNSLSAIISSAIIIRFFGKKIGFDYVKEIILFFAFAGIITSLISSMVGTYSLYYYKIIFPAYVFNTWFTWMLGDFIGIIIFTPLIVLIYNYVINIDSLSRLLFYSIAILFTFIVSLVIFFVARTWEINFIQYRINSDSKLIYNSILNNLHQQFNVIKLMGHYVSISENFTKEKFNYLADKNLKQSKAVIAFSWNQMITHKQRNLEENLLKKNYNHDEGILVRDKDGDLLKSPDFEEYVFVKYIFPFKGNEEAIGFNVYSNSKRKKALILAKERKSLEVTEKISLVQKEEKSNGLLVFYPVNSKINGFGYSTAVVVISELINKAVSNVSDGGLCLVIEDRTAKKDSTLYKSGCEDLKDSIIQKFKVNKVFKIGSREWEFIVYPKGSYILKNLSGSSGFILIISSVLTGILGMLILIVTGREKVINQVVKGRTKELEKANKIKSEFLANMSHEIRTPMNGVLGMLTLLETTNINDEQKEYLEDAKNSVVALLTIINDILDVSKLESKKIEIIPIKMDVIKLCNNILQLFRLEGIKKNIQLRFVFNKKVNNYFIQADENRLRQILINLVGNAIKFTTKGSIELNVSVDENNKRIEFSVKDTGIGISEEDIRKLFDRFVQLESSRTKKFEGAGLGLYISKQLIVLMGGNIQIQSEVSKGSNFHFHIPLIKSDVNLEKEIKDTNLIKKKTEPNSFNILIAEDNPINQKFIKKILEKNGYQLDIANNGLEVIHILDNSISGNRFDLILMDIQMPEMDGLSATKLIRQRKDIYSEIPILALTANTMEPQVKEYLENGMNGCIKKPIILEDLISEINRWERTQKIKKPLS